LPAVYPLDMNPDLQALGARRALRRAVWLDCELLADEGRELRPGLITDLSPHGIWVETDVPLREGDALSVSFVPPGDRKQTLTAATVVRVSRGVDGTGMGLSFAGETRALARQLEHTLEGLPPRVPFRSPGSSGPSWVQMMDSLEDDVEEILEDELLYDDREVIVLRPQDVELLPA